MNLKTRVMKVILKTPFWCLFSRHKNFSTKMKEKKMSLSIRQSVEEQFSFKGKMCNPCMFQIWEGALWALMCQERLDMLMTIMAGEQLKGMYLKNVSCGLKTLKILWKGTSDQTCHKMMQSCWRNLVFIVFFSGVKCLRLSRSWSGL